MSRRLPDKHSDEDEARVQAMIAADPEDEDVTEAQMARAKPFAEALPDLAASIRRRGKQKAPTKVGVFLRLDPDVVDHFRRSGRGWQTRMGTALRKVAGL